MQLTIDGQRREFVSIASFRAEHGLPPDFGVNLFEPKAYAGLGHIDQAGGELRAVRDAVIAAIPVRLNPAQLMDFLPQLSETFRFELYAVNDRIELKAIEIDYAASGFADVMQALLYAVIHANAAKTPHPAFDRVYQDWLESTVRVSQQIYPYEHQGADWRVQVISTAYGRAGLLIDTDMTTYYVRDAALACPAEGYTQRLLYDVATAVLGALERGT